MFGKKDQRQEMDAELFEALKVGLRGIFDKHVKENDTLDKAFHDSTYGIAAAQAGQALIELHRDFKPTPR